MNSFDEITTYILRVISTTTVQLVVLGGPVLIAIYIISNLANYVQRKAFEAMHIFLYILLFGWFGVLVHETSHAIIAMFFRHNIKSFKPLLLNLGSDNRVDIEENEGNILSYMGLFFVGIAPVIFGVLAIFVSMYLLFYDQMYLFMKNTIITEDISGGMIGHVLSSSLSFMSFLFSPSHIRDWRLYFFLYIAFSIGSNMGLSSDDTEKVKSGCCTFIVLLFVFNFVLITMNISSSSTFNWIIPYYTIFYIVLSFVIWLDLIAIAILWIPAVVRIHHLK